MNESSSKTRDAAAVVASPPTGPDWRVVADQRLTRLVELEHDHSIVRDRLNALQVDYREVLVAAEDRLQRIGDIEDERARLESRLAELRREHGQMFESFVKSRSWRLTRPFRVVRRMAGRDLRGAARILRYFLKFPFVRRVARFMVRCVPGLHARLRSRLYP
jgi:hypothetical protein